jgi:hypothetical protein
VVLVWFSLIAKETGHRFTCSLVFCLFSLGLDYYSYIISLKIAKALFFIQKCFRARCSGSFL